MIKKYTSIAFIFLANIIFFAHEVFFHHHADGQVCFEHITNNNINGPKKQNIPEDTNDESCLLADIIFLISANKKSQIVCDCYFNDGEVQSNFSAHFALIKAETLINLIPFPFRQKPYFEYCNVFGVKHSVGLRAPPIA